MPWRNHSTLKIWSGCGSYCQGCYDVQVGAQQRVEIIKTLYRGADLLIFDEPTAVLTSDEITGLLKIMKVLVSEGKSIILITHKLDEIRAVADRVTVIRRGNRLRLLKLRVLSMMT